MSKPEWLPKNPFRIFGGESHSGDAAKIWDHGAQVTARALIARYEELIDDPACESFRAALKRLKAEVEQG